MIIKSARPGGLGRYLGGGHRGAPRDAVDADEDIFGMSGFPPEMRLKLRRVASIMRAELVGPKSATSEMAEG